MMRLAVIGLGSMGRRRIRNIQSINNHLIFGFDSNIVRAQQVAKETGIQLIDDPAKAIREGEFDAVIISTSPDWHMHYAEICVEAKTPVFIEASVVEAERVGKLASLSEKLGVLVAPSCTMRFFEGPKLVKKLISEGQIGKPLFFTYHTGQWLEDWHPWESVNDFYVSKAEMGGCREIVPFELTWLNDVFGDPVVTSAKRDKISDLPVGIDDIYQIHLEYPEKLQSSIVIEVLSKPVSTRELRVVGTEGILKFTTDSSQVLVRNADNERWVTFELSAGTRAKDSINPDEPYREELETFLNAVEGKIAFPNTLIDDYKVLQALETIDEVSAK